jgi:hypothetical protein
LLYGLKCDLFWKKFHGLLRRISILHLLDGVFCRCLVKNIWFMVQFNYNVSLLIFFCLDDVSIGESMVLKPYNINVLGGLSVLLWMFVLWNWEYQLSMNIYIYTYIWLLHLFDGLFPWLICSDFLLSLLNNFGSKSALSDLSIAIPVCFLLSFA